MYNKLNPRYQKLLWRWTWQRLREDRIRDVEEKFGKKFAEWAIEQKDKLTKNIGKDSDIPIYSGSLGLIVDLIDKDIEEINSIINNIISGDTKVGSYTHDQGMPSDTWVIRHNLHFNPSITIVDETGIEHEGYVRHTSNDACVVKFNAAFSGKAYCS